MVLRKIIRRLTRRKEENRAICDVCGKVFTGENAGMKVGGHKRTHR